MIVTFGEIMLRLSPPDHLRLRQAHTFDLVFGGAEANVAVSLANFGLPSRFVTKLPENDIGKACLSFLRQHNIDTSGIIWGGERLGIYFYERGISQRPASVLYDRKGSAISQSRPAEFNWTSLLHDATRFHFTGITPALGKDTAQITMDACKAAKKLGAQVSCDLNYRENLWSREEARACITELMPLVDLLFLNERHARDIFFIQSDKTNPLEKYADIAKQIESTYRIHKIALTVRIPVSASLHDWSAFYYDNGTLYQSKQYRIEIVDRSGGGDSFDAGLLYSLQTGESPQKALDFATAASCLKHSIYGDCNLSSLEEVHSFMLSQGV